MTFGSSAGTKVVHPALVTIRSLIWERSSGVRGELTILCGPADDIDIASSVLIRTDHTVISIRDDHPIETVIALRSGIDGQEGAVLRAWVPRICVGGALAIHGWLPRENPSIPPLGLWIDGGSRAWCPLLHENVFTAWRCLGSLTTADGTIVRSWEVAK